MSSPTIPASAFFAVQAKWLSPLIWPCDLLRDGACGLFLLDGKTYALAVQTDGGFKVRQGRAAVIAYRILTPAGKTYDIDLTADYLACECPAFEQGQRDGRVCKHLAGLKALGLPLTLAGANGMPEPEAGPAEATKNDGDDDGFERP